MTTYRKRKVWIYVTDVVGVALLCCPVVLQYHILSVYSLLLMTLVHYIKGLQFVSVDLPVARISFPSSSTG